MTAALVVALGPGEPELVPAAALDELARHPAVQLAAGSPELAAALEAGGAVLADEAPVLCAPDRDALALARHHGCPSVPALHLLARQAAAHAAGALLDLTERLRRECPWDRVQTAPSIVPHTVEEAYEVAEAVQSEGLSPKLIDELGDLLFQTTFLALLCDEVGVGDWADVATGVELKLRRRHPWVFGEEQLSSAGAARGRWDAVKRSTEEREGIFHDVPATLPGLLLARKVQRRAAAVGFEYPDAEGAYADLRSEVAELDAELAGREPPQAEHEGSAEVAAELGDLLFAAVNVARRWNADPELAVRAAAARFRARVERAEALAASDGVEFAAAGLEQQERYYQAAKQALRSDHEASR